MWDRIIKVLEWSWDNKADILAMAGPYATFALIAGGLVTALLQKTPDGDPAQITDEMIEELKQNWRGELPPSEELGFPIDSEE